jgi:hypothetical protein
MKDAKFNISQDGSIMYSKINPKTGEITGELKDVRALNLPQNIQDNKIVVTDSVKELTKNWNMVDIFKDLGRGGELTTSSVKNHKDYKDMKATVVKSILNSSRSTLGVLADNGGMIPVFYTTDADYKKKRAEEIAEITEQNRIAGREVKEPTKEQLAEIDFNMVKKTIGPDGTINPELTQAQRTRAEEMVGIEVDGQMETKVSGQARQAYNAGESKTPEKQGYATYSKIADAYKVQGEEGERMLKNLSGGNYRFKFNNGLLSVYGYIDGKVDWKNPLIRNAKDASEASRYIYGATDASGIDKSLEQFKAEKSAYWNEKKASGGKDSDPLDLGI